jgi:UDP-galactopyranose mutase
MFYDYLIVGAGFFGSVFARLATDDGKKCLVIDKRNHIAGNCYTESIENINVHVYGPHIFHTNDKNIWNFVNRFAEFNNFILSPKSKSKDKLYSLPFNMNTFYEIWNTKTPEEAKQKIEEQKFKGIPSNLEEQALSLVGKDVYEILIKDYTTKQWGKLPKELPPFIIKRLPVRFTYDNNYFNDRYQGIPVGGYTKLFENILKDIEVVLNVDYLKNKNYYNNIAKYVVYTGCIDEFFNYEFGKLDYRSLEFKTEILETKNYQGCAIMNYNDVNIPWTRIVEHKHFEKCDSEKTVITKEYPKKYEIGSTPYYPINDEKNNSIYKKYKEKTKTYSNIIFGGRLAEYKYYDMHMVIASAMTKYKNHISGNIEKEL